MKTITSIVVVGLVVFGCHSREAKLADQISGAYAREYSFAITHPETGLEVGMRTIRDTIFIKFLGEKFEVSNHKWGKNDYDAEGWRDMEHSDNRPFPPFTVVLENDGTLLSPVQSNAGMRLYLDLSKGTISYNDNSEMLYKKI